MAASHLLSVSLAGLGVLAAALGCWQFIRTGAYALHPLPAATDGERALALNNAVQIVG